MVLAVANLAVFWFELYKILVFANFGIAVVLLLAEFLMPTGRRRNWSVTFSFLALYAYILLTCIWSPLPSDAFENAGRAVASALPAFFAGEYLTRRYDLDKILAGLACMAFVLAPQVAFNLYQNGDPALVGDFSIRTIFGIMFAVFTPVAVGLYLSSRRLIFLAAALISFAAVLILQSRAGTLIGPAATLILIYAHNKKLARQLLLFGAAPLLFVGSLTMSGEVGRFTGIDTSVEIDENIFAEFAIDRSLRVDFDRRLHTFLAGRMFGESPAFGGGYFSMSQNNKFDFGIDLTAHGYPGFLAELGVVGALFFIAFVYFGMRDFLRSARANASGKLSIYDHTFVAGFVAIIMAGFFHQQVESAFFGLMAGLLAGLAAPIKASARQPRSRGNVLLAAR